MSVRNRGRGVAYFTPEDIDKMTTYELMKKYRSLRESIRYFINNGFDKNSTEIVIKMEAIKYIEMKLNIPKDKEYKIPKIDSPHEEMGEIIKAAVNEKVEEMTKIFEERLMKKKEKIKILKEKLNKEKELNKFLEEKTGKELKGLEETFKTIFEIRKRNGTPISSPIQTPVRNLARTPVRKAVLEIPDRESISSLKNLVLSD